MRRLMARRRRLVAWPGMALWLALPLSPGHAANARPQTVAVADFDYQDSSGETRDQTAAHAARLAALKSGIITILANSGELTARALSCPKAPCSADQLDQAAMTAAAHAGHADFVVFGAIHKISSLIQFGEIEVMRVSDGKAVLAKTITFRGDSEDAWQHATDFVGQMLVTALHGQFPPAAARP